MSKRLIALGAPLALAACSLAPAEIVWAVEETCSEPEATCRAAAVTPDVADPTAPAASSRRAAISPSSSPRRRSSITATAPATR